MGCDAPRAACALVAGLCLLVLAILASTQGWDPTCKGSFECSALEVSLAGAEHLVNTTGGGDSRPGTWLGQDWLTCKYGHVEVGEGTCARACDGGVRRATCRCQSSNEAAESTRDGAELSLYISLGILALGVIAAAALCLCGFRVLGGLGAHARAAGGRRGGAAAAREAAADVEQGVAASSGTEQQEPAAEGGGEEGPPADRAAGADAAAQEAEEDARGCCRKCSCCGGRGSGGGGGGGGGNLDDGGDSPSCRERCCRVSEDWLMCCACFPCICFTTMLLWVVLLCCLSPCAAEEDEGSRGVRALQERSRVEKAARKHPGKFRMACALLLLAVLFLTAIGVQDIARSHEGGVFERLDTFMSVAAFVALTCLIAALLFIAAKDGPVVAGVRAIAAVLVALPSIGFAGLVWSLVRLAQPDGLYHACEVSHCIFNLC